MSSMMVSDTSLKVSNFLASMFCATCSLNSSTKDFDKSLFSSPAVVSLSSTLLPSSGLGSRTINPLFSSVFRVLERLVASMPIFGAIAVEGVPWTGSIDSNAKPVAIEVSCLAASSLYILAMACHAARYSASIVGYEVVTCIPQTYKKILCAHSIFYTVYIFFTSALYFSLSTFRFNFMVGVRCPPSTDQTSGVRRISFTFSH